MGLNVFTPGVPHFLFFFLVCVCVCCQATSGSPVLPGPPSWGWFTKGTHATKRKPLMLGPGLFSRADAFHLAKKVCCSVFLVEGPGNLILELWCFVGIPKSGTQTPKREGSKTMSSSDRFPSTPRRDINKSATGRWEASKPRHA